MQRQGSSNGCTAGHAHQERGMSWGGRQTNCIAHIDRCANYTGTQSIAEGTRGFRFVLGCHRAMLNVRASDGRLHVSYHLRGWIERLRAEELPVPCEGKVVPRPRFSAHWPSNNTSPCSHLGRWWRWHPPSGQLRATYSRESHSLVAWISPHILPQHCGTDQLQWWHWTASACWMWR